MTENEAELEHRTLEAIRQLDEQEEAIGWQRRELFSLLFETKPWKQHKLTKKQYIVSIGYKPSTIDLELRLLEKYARVLKDSKHRVSKSRLQDALSIKFPSEDDLTSFIEEYCLKDIPYDAFNARIKELTGKSHIIECNHAGPHEFWHKCCQCKTWIEDKG